MKCHRLLDASCYGSPGETFRSEGRNRSGFLTVTRRLVLAHVSHRLMSTPSGTRWHPDILPQEVTSALRGPVLIHRVLWWNWGIPSGISSVCPRLDYWMESRAEIALPRKRILVVEWFYTSLPITHWFLEFHEFVGKQKDKHALILCLCSLLFIFLLHFCL